MPPTVLDEYGIRDSSTKAEDWALQRFQKFAKRNQMRKLLNRDRRIRAS